MSEKAFLKYRNVWMGLAMLWIVRFHLGLYPSSAVLDFLMRSGYGGTDVFLFASGIGCYYSLTRDPDPYRFLKRRFIRLYPTYLCFILVWIVFHVLTEALPVEAVVGSLLGIQYYRWLGNDFNWYIGGIFLLYLLSSVFYSVVNRMKGKQHIPVILVLMLLSVPFWNDWYAIVLTTRIAIFYVGMLFGKICINGGFNKRVRQVSVAVTAVGWAVLILLVFCGVSFYVLWNYGLYWYPFLLITPGMCVLYSLVMGKLEKFRLGRGILLCLDKIGTYSFEVYLVHIFVIEVMEYMISPMGLLPDTNGIWVLAPIVTVPCCFLLHWTVAVLGKCTAKLRRALVAAEKTV